MQITVVHSQLPLHLKVYFMSASAGDNAGEGASEGMDGPGHGDEGPGGGGENAEGFGFGMEGRGNAAGLGGMSGASSAGQSPGESGQYGMDMADFSGLVGGLGTGATLSNRIGLQQALARSVNPSMVLGAVGATAAAALGGKLGKGVLGAIGGMVAGPVGAVVGAVIGGKYGAAKGREAMEAIANHVQNANTFGPTEVAGLAGQIGVSPGELQGALDSAYSDDSVTSAFESAAVNNVEEFTGGLMATPAQTAASYQQQALDYLKERNALPQALRDKSLQQLGGAFGLPSYEQQSEQFFAGLQEHPLYQQLMGQLPESEDAIMRTAGATGQLRSGNVKDALATNAADIKRQATLDTYNAQVSGLGGLAGLSSYDAGIAGGMTDIGESLSAGQLAQDRMDQAETGQNIELGLKAYELVGGYEGISDMWSSASEYISSWI